MKDFIILGGLPRCGITLLSALLNQHPEIYVTTTSPFVEILWRTYSVWTDEYTKYECNTDKIQKIKRPFLKSITDSYFNELTDKPIIIDKRRQWQNVTNIEMYLDIYEKLPKVIAPVRKVEYIIKSYLKLFQKQSKYLDLETAGFQKSYDDFKSYYESDYSKKILLIEYDDLINETQNILNDIYVYVEASPFVNDFTQITSFENESYHGINGLHEIRKTISKNGNDINLSNDLMNKYKEYNIWL